MAVRRALRAQRASLSGEGEGEGLQAGRADKLPWAHGHVQCPKNPRKGWLLIYTLDVAAQAPCSWPPWSPREQGIGPGALPPLGWHPSIR